MTDYYCQKHNCKLEITYVHEGTPYQDFNGYECPECRKEKEERHKAWIEYTKTPEYKAQKAEEEKLRRLEMRIKGWEEIVQRPGRSWEDIDQHWGGLLKNFF